MIIVEKVLKFIVQNEYFNHETLKLIERIFNDLERHSIAKDLALKIELFLIKNGYLILDDSLKKKLEKDNFEDIEDLLKLAVEEDFDVEQSILEKIFSKFYSIKGIFKYSLALLCKSSETYITTALKNVKNDPDTAIFALSVSKIRNAIPVIMKHIDQCSLETFREAVKILAFFDEEHMILKLLRSSSLDVQKKIFILSVTSEKDFDRLSESMLKIAANNCKRYPAFAVNALKNIRKIQNDDSFYKILDLYEKIPNIYAHVFEETLTRVTSDDKHLDTLIVRLLYKFFVKKGIDFIKEIGNNEIKNSIAKSFRIEKSMDDIAVINNQLQNLLEKYGKRTLILKNLTSIKDKDIKFFALQHLLEGNTNRDSLNIDYSEELINSLIKVLTRRKYTQAKDIMSLYLFLDGKLYHSAIEFFSTLRIKDGFTHSINVLFEHKINDAPIIKALGDVKVDNGLEILSEIIGKTNDIATIRSCLYSFRFYTAGKVYDYIKDFLDASNPIIVSTALDTLVYLRYEPVKDLIPVFYENKDPDIKRTAVKGMVKFNMPLEKVIDYIDSLDNNGLSSFFSNLSGIFNPSFVEILLYSFTQKEFKSDTMKCFFKYIKSYPNRELVIEKLNNVLKAI
ncbi:MAG: hypothetical protein C0601_11155 [Candidatus Muiribacterium halophilum]|uniref:HEAT repeat domain-containing protein n=1 Tax=Muiribacterium halophilum TaxID=2053465 RepID=A0A2N5ZBW8_MUIH1|nr:MAG: hypothetical protein C0601_11155 [Candidatus Muirbacterium halophilum]